MSELFLNNVYLVLLLPLWLFLIIMLGRFFSVYVNKYIIQVLTLLSSFSGSVLCVGALWRMPVDKILEMQVPFIKVNDFVIFCGIYVDRLSLIFALVLFLISFCVQLFAISYMKNEKKNYRFFALLNLFNFGMAGLFFSPNLLEAYLFWEIVGVVSYLLIGFEYFKKEKSIASKKVFIINRIGDTALIGAIISCAYFLYTYAPNKTFTTLSFVDMNTISTLIYAYTSTPIFWLICVAFLVGAIVKSAQFPFYTWLQDAMEAKLPVSALLHSATMVASGIFLTIRLMPLYSLEIYLPKIIGIVGLLTALVCSLAACAQTNPKKTLAYSTSAQLGLMFFAIGMLNIKAAVGFFVAHAFIKTALFLALPREKESWSYPKFIIFLISGLSLSGVILSGMIAKEFIALDLGTILTVVFCIISFLTAFYIIRIALVVADENGLESKLDSKIEISSLIGLIVLNVLYYIYLRTQVEYKVAESFWAAMTAWICVYILYKKNAFWKVPLLYQLSYNGFYLDKIYSQVCVKFYEKCSQACSFVDKNIFAEYKPLIYIARKLVQVSDFVETKVLNGTVDLLSDSMKKFSVFDKKAQVGDVQRYNAYAFIIITIILTCLTFGYITIMTYIGGFNG